MYKIVKEQRKFNHSSFHCRYQFFYHCIHLTPKDRLILKKRETNENSKTKKRKNRKNQILLNRIIHDEKKKIFFLSVPRQRK